MEDSSAPFAAPDPCAVERFEGAADRIRGLAPCAPRKAREVRDGGGGAIGCRRLAGRRANPASMRRGRTSGGSESHARPSLLPVSDLGPAPRPLRRVFVSARRRFVRFDEARRRGGAGLFGRRRVDGYRDRLDERLRPLADGRTCSVGSSAASGSGLPGCSITPGRAAGSQYGRRPRSARAAARAARRPDASAPCTNVQSSGSVASPARKMRPSIGSASRTRSAKRPGSAAE